MTILVWFAFGALDQNSYQFRQITSCIYTQNSPALPHYIEGLAQWLEQLTAAQATISKHADFKVSVSWHLSVGPEFESRSPLSFAFLLSSTCVEASLTCCASATTLRSFGALLNSPRPFCFFSP